VPGEPWRELPEMLGVTQSALLLFQYGWALLLQGRPEAEQCLNAALAAAEETDQVACWVLVALQLSQLYLLKGDFEAAENWLQRCLSRGQQAPEADWATLWPRIFRAYLRMGSGQLEKAQESFKRLQADLATRADFYSHRHSVEIGLGLLALRQGDAARAEEILQNALKARTQLYNDTYVLAMNSMAWIEFRRGDLAAARARLRQSLAFSGRRSLLQNYAITTLEIARMELKAGGNLAAVEALLRHAVQLTEEAGFHSTSSQLNTAINDILAAATVNG
jgi:Tfp pilus assembly protein PilF